MGYILIKACIVVVSMNDLLKLKIILEPYIFDSIYEISLAQGFGRGEI